METIGININTTAGDKHVPEIEQYIWTVKEGIRAMTNTLPLDKLPHQLIVTVALQCSILNTLFSTQKWKKQHSKPMNNNHGIQKRFQRALQITIRNKCANA